MTSTAVETLTELIRDVKQRQVPIVCPGHSRPIAEVAYSSVTPDGTFLISACHDKKPMLRVADDLTNFGGAGDWIGTFDGHKGAVWSAKLCCHALLAATGGGDFTAKVWNAVTGELKQEFDHKHIVKTVDFAPSRSRLATGGREGILRIYDLANPDSAPIQLKHEGAHINKVQWCGNDTLFSGDSKGCVRMWDVRSSSCTKKIADLGAPVMDLELCDGLGIVTVASGEHVSFYSSNDLTMLKKHAMPVHFRNEGGCSLHPTKGDRFIVGGGRHGGSSQGAMGVMKGAEVVGDLDSDLIVYVYDYETGAQLEANKGHHGPVRCLRYHPDGKSYATGSEDGTIRIWQTDPKPLESDDASEKVATSVTDTDDAQ